MISLVFVTFCKQIFCIWLVPFFLMITIGINMAMLFCIIIAFFGQFQYDFIYIYINSQWFVLTILSVLVIASTMLDCLVDKSHSGLSGPGSVLHVAFSEQETRDFADLCQVTRFWRGLGAWNKNHLLLRYSLPFLKVRKPVPSRMLNSQTISLSCVKSNKIGQCSEGRRYFYLWDFQKKKVCQGCMHFFVPFILWGIGSSGFAKVEDKPWWFIANYGN